VNFMKIINGREEMRGILKALRADGKTIGFVPTMGFLHEGHLSLVKRARAENDIVVVSIFVNPTQFAPHEDFDVYPRDLERDKKLLDGYADYIFSPVKGEIYGVDEKITVGIKDLTACFCGISRPHHFPGVVQVVAKLLNIIAPRRVYFGQKDYQQSVVVRHMIDELFFDTELVVCPTVREHDGLAMSSRNKYLSAEERVEAPVLNESLRYAKKSLAEGESDLAAVVGGMEKLVKSRPHARIDYIDVREAGSLEKVDRIGEKPVVIAMAVFFGKTRLIDNLVYNPVDVAEK